MPTSIFPATDLRSWHAQRPAFQGGTSRPSDFLRRSLELIDRHEPHVRAFTATNVDRARTEVEASDVRWRAGSPLSSIDGMPIGVKDVMETADMPTGQGSALFTDFESGRDCAAVAALREAGAIILAKTVTTEFAARSPNQTRNPFDLSRTPGGSSSGSGAAVGIGMLPAALGTQVIGSIIRPASFCGTFGFKPSVGALNRGGSFDVFSQSATGVLGASLEDCWIVARTISERAGGDPGSAGLVGPLDPPEPRPLQRVASLRSPQWETASEGAQRAFQSLQEHLKELGIVIEDASTDTLLADIEEDLNRSMDLSVAINAWEGRWPLNTYARDMDRAKLSESALETLERSMTIDQEEYASLLAERTRIRRRFQTLQEEFDSCISLSASGCAPVGLHSTGDPSFSSAASLLGAPAISLPLMQDEQLPLGLQLIGFMGHDSKLFSHARYIWENTATRAG